MKAIKFFAALFMLFAVSASVNAQELDKASQKALKKVYARSVRQWA